MKVAVRVIGRPYRGQPVGSVFNVSRGNSRVLVATKQVELVDEATPAEAVKVAKVTQAVAKTVAKKAAAKKAPAKTVAAKKTTTRVIRSTQNRSMASKTDAKDA